MADTQGLNPQPLDDAIWDCARRLIRLRLRILRNGDGLSQETQEVYATQLTNMINLLASWLEL